NVRMLASCSEVNSLRKIAMNLQKADRQNGVDRLTASSGLQGRAAHRADCFALGSAAAARRSRCGTTVYLGSFADWTPAWKTPKRVQAEPARSAAPLSAAAARLRPPNRAPPVAPATDRISPARTNRPALPFRYGSATRPARCSIH